MPDTAAANVSGTASQRYGETVAVGCMPLLVAMRCQIAMPSKESGWNTDRDDAGGEQAAEPSEHTPHASCGQPECAKDREVAAADPDPECERVEEHEQCDCARDRESDDRQPADAVEVEHARRDEIGGDVFGVVAVDGRDRLC